jgi:hypothetical protein
MGPALVARLVPGGRDLWGPDGDRGGALKKGRDLFDIWWADRHDSVDFDRVRTRELITVIAPAEGKPAMARSLRECKPRPPASVPTGRGCQAMRSIWRAMAAIGCCLTAGPRSRPRA